MRRLTEAEVTKEVEDIKTRPWPHNSVLPMKNLYDHQDRRVGTIFRTYDGGPDTIVPEIVLPSKDVPPIKYASLKALVEDGWVVD